MSKRFYSTYYHNNEYYYGPTCPYCGENLKILKISIKLEFKTPKIPPSGAKDLQLFNVTPKIYSKKYALCSRCKANYSYDDFNLICYSKALTNRPSASILIKNILNEELPKYPANVIYKVIWVKKYREQFVTEKSNHFAINLINSLYNKLNGCYLKPFQFAKTFFANVFQVLSGHFYS